MIYSKTRRDIKKGSVPKNFISLTAKNRFNILCAINLKGTDTPPLDFVIIEESTNSAIFLQFVKRLLTNGTLSRGDYFVMDNCTVHNKGDNIGS